MGEVTPIVPQSALGRSAVFQCYALAELCLELLLVLKEKRELSDWVVNC